VELWVRDQSGRQQFLAEGRVSAPPYAVRSTSLSLPCSNIFIAPFGLGHGALGRGFRGLTRVLRRGQSIAAVPVFEMVNKSKSFIIFCQYHPIHV
jgi:hypothetical protein